MTTFSAAGGGGLVGVAAFPLQCQWICTMVMFYPAPNDGRYSNGLRCLILLYLFNFKVYVFYILVTLVSVLLRPTTSLLWLILSVPMCIDVTMCMLMLLFYDSCAMLAIYVSIKFLLTLFQNVDESAPINMKYIHGMLYLVHVAHCHDCGFFILMRYDGDKDIHAALEVIFEIVWCTFVIALSLKLEKKQGEDLLKHIIHKNKYALRNITWM